MELNAEAVQSFDTNEVYIQPTWRQYHEGSFMGMGIIGWRYTDFDPIFGLNMGYDLTTMAPNLLQQVSWGIELRDDVVELHIRHYRPWPKEKEANGYKFIAHYHTDFDFLIKGDNFHGGFGFYENKKVLGAKVSFTGFFKELSLDLHWKFDQLMKHCSVLSFGWNFPSKGKNTFNNCSHFIYTKEKLAPVTSPPLLATSLVAEEQAQPSSSGLYIYTVERPINATIPEIKEDPEVEEPKKSGWFW